MIRLQNGCKNYFVVFKKNKKLVWYATGSPDLAKAKQIELELRSELSKTREKDRLKHFIERMTGEKVEEHGMLINSAWSYYKDEYCKGQAVLSVRRKELEWQAFVKWLEGRYPEKKFLHEINFRIAKEYEKVLERKKTSGHNFNLKVSMLKGVIKSLRQQADMSENPFETIKSKPKINIPYKALNDAEIAAILKNSNDSWKTACIIALHTGLDFANVRNTKWSELVEIEIGDEKRLFIQTVRRKTERKLKGKPLRIPVSKELEKHLLSLKRAGEYILPDRFRTRNIEGEFPAILKESEITTDGYVLGFHCWRHTFNSRLQANGVAVDTRQQLTGHSSMDMNLIYSNSMKPLFDAIDGTQKNNEVKK